MSVYFPTPDEMAGHTIFPGVKIQTAACERMMLSLVQMQPGAVVADHSHPHEQVGIVLEGGALFVIGGEEKTLSPGNIFRIPGGVQHRVIAGPEGLRALDVFNPVREEYK